VSRNLSDARRFKQEQDAALSLIDPVLKKARGGNIEEAESIGADRVVATDDDHEIANLPLVDAVADTVNGKTAEMLIAEVKPGG
jgi:NADPH:quinone reductase-like Zn-dependent oxidoreductase